MKIEIWGTYPPPIGGVSIHIYRLIHSLHTIDSSIVLRNLGKHVPDIPYVKHVSYPWVEFLLLPFRKKRIIHLHSNNIFAFVLFILLGGRHKVGVTLHNQNLIRETSFIRTVTEPLLLYKVKYSGLSALQHHHAFSKASTIESGKEPAFTVSKFCFK